MDDPTSAATPPDVTPPRRRRRFILSLRALMLLVLVGGGAFGWKARRVSIQRRAVATIRAAGGIIRYDHLARPDGTWLSPKPPPAPEWLRRLVGDEPFQEVAGISLHSQWDPIDDAVLDAYLSLDRAGTLNLGTAWLADEQAGRIARAAHLKSFECTGSIVGPGGFERLCRRADLETLAFDIHPSNGINSYNYRSATGENLQRTFRGKDLITPGDLAPIRSLVHLKRLRISDNTRATFRELADEDYLPHVAALRQLEALELWSRVFEDADLQLLAPLARLETLGINGSHVTDEGLAIAAGWPRLKSLSFRAQNFERHRNSPTFRDTPARLTDAGLVHLHECRRLEKLALIGARFADPGMAVLADLPALRELELDGFDATPAGVGPLLARHQFERLTLMGPAVGDWVVPMLVGQQRLKGLALVGPGLTDAAAPGLVRLRALEALDLHGSRLTDAGLGKLAASTAPLDSIDLRGTAVTPAAAASFRATHPQTQVVTGPDDGGY